MKNYLAELFEKVRLFVLRTKAKISAYQLKESFEPKTEVSRYLTIFKEFLLFTMVIALIGFFIGITYIQQVVSEAPTLVANDFIELDSSKVFDADGILIADIGTQIRENIHYSDLPQTTIDAFVAVEDSRFFEHSGFDVPRFTKALLENLMTLSFSQGGSTFTMQLVKSTYFETEDALAARSGLEGINRKIQEISLALAAEKIVDKERILEMYLNRINFGVPLNNRGIQTAAKFYFGKDVSELGLVESAVLAGVINAPNAYNPIKNLDLATQRTHIVLDLMEYHGYITKEENALAHSVRIENLIVGQLTVEQTVSNTNPNQAYIDAVIAETKKLTGQDPAYVSMKIYTAMDRNLQTQIEAIENGEVSEVEWPNDIIQTGIVSMNTKTGEILAIGGGRFYEGERLFNRGTDMIRQPGSSAKLILTYPLAFEYLGWSTQHTLYDRPIIYTGTDVVIRNWDNQYRGQVSVAYALGNSLNIPAIETMGKVATEISNVKTVEYLNSIGFTSITPETFDLGYGIGGSTFKASPLQMANAYAAMINAGEFINAHTITKIEFNDGSDPIEPSYPSTQVLSAEAAYMTAMMMEQDVTGPYGNFMQILKSPYQVYAKTGTSDWGETGLEYGIPEGAAKDKWMIAGTSEIVTAVWVGYDKAELDQISYLDRAQINLNLPGHINNAILDAYYEDRNNPPSVPRPAGVTDITHVKGVFPYVAPTEATSGDMIVTGLIKSSAVPSPFTTLSTPISFPNSFGFYNGQTMYGKVQGYDPYSAYVYYTIIDYPAHGELLLNAETGEFTYNHYGDGQNDRFTFTTSYSSPAEVTLNLLPN